ncbi:Helix-turn-helix [Terribacillus halophilus]|uniref:Helix-turn-helix n=1 Tax=Terribacillus halophilus TaxID=361279 RepID=A0A1G6QYL5_9BACI|nr:helix-turn-helix domain-containing protein [Terribacillus halophilus]SDC97283.1 Helix-turn-helix [Terribacillus halophilus]
MEIGPLIKLHRIKQNMTQEDLAAGIVSESYLSKIENQKTDASPEVIALLCERLDIQLNAENEDMIKEKAEEWYGMLYEVHNADERRQRFEELQTLFKANNSDHEMLFEIQKIRFFLVEGRVKEAREQIERLEQVQNSFDGLQSFYWNKFVGNYYHMELSEFTKALRFYKEAESTMDKLDLLDDEKADLLYVISILHSKLVNDLSALEYANKALSIFRNSYKFVRCAQCHIILGIAYRRLHMLEEAIKQYNLAKHLGEITDNNDVIQLTNHNLGYLHSRAGNSIEAIAFYKSAFNLRNVPLNYKLTTVTSLIREYILLKEYAEAQNYIVQAEQIMNENLIGSKLVKLEIKVFKTILNQDYVQYEDLVTNHLIPFLLEQEDKVYTIIYSNMIAAHYEDIKKYKNAAYYYKLASKSYEDLLKI